MNNLPKKIFRAGVVGAGGGGFPTHVKAKSEVEIVIANGAECEPLLHKDYELMLHFPKEIVRGMELMMEQTKAVEGFFGIKEKNSAAVEAINGELEETNIKMKTLGDFYPIGDEYELVYEITGRLIPPHGIPLNVGCLVNNVESFYNIAKADEGIPVTEKFLTVTGAVKNPVSFFVPLGTTFREAIEFAGGSTEKEFGVFISGLMMGTLTFDLEDVVTKTTAGLIVLPKEHYLIQRMNRAYSEMNRIGKSACDQCSYCTEFCPRYLLGYDVQPHKVMRTLGFSESGKDYWNNLADLCCGCGFCSLYACPEDLYPREACVQSKNEMRVQGIKYEQVKPVKVHPVKDGRRVPLKQLMKKLNVTQYNKPTPFTEGFKTNVVKIKMKQHAGAPADSIVKKGSVVKKGDIIGKVAEDALGANVHASISGVVTEVNDDFVKIENI